jgi:8-oxo-dGTP pyrophosphatase MutT (NUDIX family)
MEKVAKLVVIADKNNYLLMQRSNHLTFPSDPDLHGGTVEAGELLLDAMLREVLEEASFLIDQEDIKMLYDGNESSAHHIYYTLYVAKLAKRPEVIISWEHSSYSWLDRDQFLDKAKNAKDMYMHMVYDVMSRNNI